MSIDYAIALSYLRFICIRCLNSKAPNEASDLIWGFAIFQQQPSEDIGALTYYGQ